MEPSMSQIKWNDSYCIGNDELDNHHKLIFKILECLYNSCSNISGTNYYQKHLSELDMYVKCHFRVEEMYMMDIQYDDIQNHILMHKSFRSNLAKLKNKPDNSEKFTKELIVFLENWLLNHVIIEDRKLAHHQIPKNPGQA
jgi:hemerythrin